MKQPNRQVSVYEITNIQMFSKHTFTSNKVMSLS